MAANPVLKSNAEWETCRVVEEAATPPFAGEGRAPTVTLNSSVLFGLA
jgi:hypothetical protein